MEIKFVNTGLTINDKTKARDIILKNINLDIVENKITAIIGKSGSGKTSLVKLINFLIKPSTGKVIVDDENLNTIKALRFDVGLVFQNPQDQILEDNVYDEVSFALKHFNYKLEELNQRTLAALRMVGLEEAYLDRKIETLSMGELKRVQLASILVHNPKVIILDEPTYCLDDRGKTMLVKIIKMMQNKYHKTIIIITNDMSLIHKIADNIIVLNDKTVLLNDTKEEIFKKIDELAKVNIDVPEIVEFSKLAKTKKNIDLGNHLDVKDLIKEVYRNV